MAHDMYSMLAASIAVEFRVRWLLSFSRSLPMASCYDIRRFVERMFSKVCAFFLRFDIERFPCLDGNSVAGMLVERRYLDRERMFVYFIERSWFA